jgi:hypothetical protein
MIPVNDARAQLRELYTRLATVITLCRAEPISKPPFGLMQGMKKQVRSKLRIDSIP